MRNTNDEKIEQQSSTNEKRNESTINTNSRGRVTYEGEYASLKYQRRLSHSREAIWKEITDPKQLSKWMNTKAVIQMDEYQSSYQREKWWYN